MHSSGFKSAFLLTQQTRYSEDVYNKSINNVRKRINILSSTSMTEHSKKYPISITNPSAANSSGLYAKVSKISFDTEMMQQDVKTELFQLKKTKQYLAIVGEDIRKSNQRTCTLLESKLTQLTQDLSQKMNSNHQRNQKLTLQCQHRRQDNSRIREQLDEMSRRTKSLQDALGYYTAHDKLQLD